jgi:hypothetical protein
MCDVPNDAAFTCGGEGGAVPGPTGNAACDQCIEGCAGPEYCACLADSAFDDAGMPTGCIAYVGCIQNCLAPAADSGAEAGTPQTCSQECMGLGNTTQQGEGQALLSKVLSACANGTDNSCAM